MKTRKSLFAQLRRMPRRLAIHHVTLSPPGALDGWIARVLIERHGPHRITAIRVRADGTDCEDLSRRDEATIRAEIARRRAAP